MKRLVACLWYYFASLPVLRWLGVVGVLMLALGLALRDAQLVAGGSIPIAGIPIFIGGLHFRNLASNRRLAMVPGFASFAAVGLLLVALAGTALACVVAKTAGAEATTLHVAALAFAGISVYLVLSQWLITIRYGFFVITFALFGIAAAHETLLQRSLLAPWAWLAIGVLVWLWLALALHRHRPLRPMPGSYRWEKDSADIGGRRTGQWPERQRRSAIATAPGTLMRGLGDNWPGRIAGALMAVLLMPVVMSAIVFLMVIPSRGPGTREFSGEVLLQLAYFGVCMLPPMLFSEWPIRMRLLWLRVAGDRAGLWRRLERALLTEILLIAVVTTTVGGVALLVPAISRELAWLFMGGSVVACAFCTYLGCWVRSSGWGNVLHAVLIAIAMSAPMVAVLVLHARDQTLRAFWLLPALALLALVCRELARKRFNRVDWCAVRPRRIPRRMT